MTKITEKKPKGLWANIHAKKKRGEKSDPRSKSYKAAVKAGKKIRKQNEELAEPDGTIKFGTDSKDVKKMQKKGHTSVPYGSGYDKVSEAKMYKDVSDKFKDALDKLPQKLFTSKNVAKLAKKMKEKRPDAAMAYAKDAFGWLMKENKLRTELRKHIVKEINTIFNSLP